MSAIHSNPRIATLSRSAKTTQIEQWIIHFSTPTDGFTALHEVRQGNGISIVTQQIALENQLEIERFTNRLTAEGWRRLEKPGRG